MKWLTGLFGLLIASSGLAAPVSVPATEETVTVITSDRLLYDYKQKFALFETNVVVVDPRIKITADKMTVFFDATNKVQQIQCEHRVTISQADKTAKADQATYDVASGNIVLTGGNPEVMSGRNRMTGDPIIFNRDQNTVRVDGAVQKPRITFYPGEKEGSGDLMNIGIGELGSKTAKTNKVGHADGEKKSGHQGKP